MDHAIARFEARADEPKVTRSLEDPAMDMLTPEGPFSGDVEWVVTPAELGEVRARVVHAEDRECPNCGAPHRLLITDAAAPRRGPNGRIRSGRIGVMHATCTQTFAWVRVLDVIEGQP